MFSLHKKAAPDFESQPPILPSDVRFALQYRDGQLKTGDVDKLFRNGLQPLGFYMAMKASKDNDAVQADLLDRAAANNFDLTRLRPADATGAMKHLETQSPPSVEGKKLHSVMSLHGIKGWSGRFTEAIAPALSQKPESELFMVAHAPYVGIDELAALSLLRGRRLGILKPERLLQTEQPVGFMLEPRSQGVDITALSHDFDRPDQAIIFDDALAKGAARDRVMNFWGAESSPDFITAFVVQNRVQAPQQAHLN